MLAYLLMVTCSCWVQNVSQTNQRLPIAFHRYQFCFNYLRFISFHPFKFTSHFCKMQTKPDKRSHWAAMGTALGFPDFLELVCLGTVPENTRLVLQLQQSTYFPVEFCFTKLHSIEHTKFKDLIFQDFPTKKHSVGLHPVSKVALPCFPTNLLGFQVHLYQPTTLCIVPSGQVVAFAGLDLQWWALHRFHAARQL